MAPGGDPADVILDCFGMMHAADQGTALAERAARLAPGGVLLLQYHALAAIVRGGQWNALRHGHYAYYSTTALAGMLAAHGLRPLRGLAVRPVRRDRAAGRRARRDPDAEAGRLREQPCSPPTSSRRPRPGGAARPGRDARAQARALRDFLADQQAAGSAVIGYGAASRAVALLRWAGADAALLPAVADASPAKQGLRLPGTDIPIVSPAELTARPSGRRRAVPVRPAARGPGRLPGGRGVGGAVGGRRGASQDRWSTSALRVAPHS